MVSSTLQESSATIAIVLGVRRIKGRSGCLSQRKESSMEKVQTEKLSKIKKPITSPANEITAISVLQVCAA